ncbi:MAG: hypothetical protein ABI592_11520 [Acidobacteriota bacterium]
MRRIVLTLFAAFVFGAAPASGQWRRAGLDGQAIGAVAADPSNGSILYAASFQRIWKSVDGGDVWTRSDAGYTGDGAIGIAIDRANPARIVVASNGGIFRSTNSGATWAASNTGLSGQIAGALATDPSSSSPLWVSVNGPGGGVHRSDDWGATWTAVPLPVPGVTAASLAIRGTDVFAGWTNVLFRNRAGGGWTIPYPDTIRDGITAIAAPPGDGELVVGASSTGIRRSTSTPAPAWLPASAGLTSLHISALAVKPLEATTVYAASNGGGTFRSIDGGRTWTPVQSGLLNTDVSSLAFNPSGTRLYAGTADGIFSLDLSSLEPCGDLMALCLNRGRFRVRIAWAVPSQGTSGVAFPVPLTDDTGAFWFFTPQNLEIMIKVVDGRAFNGRFWVFYGALSNVDYTVTVFDTTTATTKTYTNSGGAIASVADTNAF